MPAEPLDHVPATFRAVFVPGALRWSVKQPFLRTTPQFKESDGCQLPHKKKSEALDDQGLPILLSIRYGQF